MEIYGDLGRYRTCCPCSARRPPPDPNPNPNPDPTLNPDPTPKPDPDPNPNPDPTPNPDPRRAASRASHELLPLAGARALSPHISLTLTLPPTLTLTLTLPLTLPGCSWQAGSSSWPPYLPKSPQVLMAGGLLLMGALSLASSGVRMVADLPC